MSLSTLNKDKMAQMKQMVMLMALLMVIELEKQMVLQKETSTAKN